MSIEISQDIFQTQGKFLVSKLDFRDLPQILKRKFLKNFSRFFFKFLIELGKIDISEHN